MFVAGGDDFWRDTTDAVVVGVAVVVTPSFDKWPNGGRPPTRIERERKKKKTKKKKKNLAGIERTMVITD